MAKSNDYDPYIHGIYSRIRNEEQKLPKPDPPDPTPGSFLMLENGLPLLAESGLLILI